MSSEALDLLRPRARVTEEELAQMPPTLTPAEARPWARVSRPAFYRALKVGLVPHLALGRSIRIPTYAYLSSLGVLEGEARECGISTSGDLETVE